MEQKAIQIGAALLAAVLLLRLAGAWERGREEMGRTLLLFSSGRLVTQVAPTETETPESGQEPAAVPVFGQTEQELVQVNAAWQVDTLSLLRQPLSWQLKGSEPTVLILHTHGTESYRADGTYQETSAYRTRDTDHNMVSVGDRVAQLLEEGGIRVIHDRTLHDDPDYNSAYGNARQAMARILEENPSVCLVLDLHRDAAEDENGNQKYAAVTVGGASCARLMLVMGSDRGSLSNPNWEQNLALAVKLQACLEQEVPGLCRPIQLVASRYNQDLSTGALLVEVGTAGNSREEALLAAEYLAEGILSLANGANLS